MDRQIATLRAENERLRGIVEKLPLKVSGIQRIMRKQGLAFDNLDAPMQKLAFTIYTDLVELAEAAEAAREDVTT